MTKERKHTVQLISAVVLLIFANLLIAAGWLVNPLGEIPNSNLVYYGEAMSFVGALMGIDYRYRIKTEKEEKEDK